MGKDTIFCYDPAFGSWKEMNVKLLNPCTGLKAIKTDRNHVYIMGGWDGYESHTSYLHTCQLFTPAKCKLVPIEKMVYRRGFHTAAFLNRSHYHKASLDILESSPEYEKTEIQFSVVKESLGMLTRGNRVVTIKPNSQAMKHKIKVGWKIVEINKHPINRKTEVGHILNEIKRKEPENPLNVTFESCEHPLYI